MAHYAFIDENNKVVEVISGKDETELIDGLDPEIWYGNFRNLKCVRTSYSGKIRFRFAGIGFTYSEEHDAFIEPEPENHLGFDIETLSWKMPEVLSDSDVI
jgi:hypothetical protein